MNRHLRHFGRTSRPGGLLGYERGGKNWKRDSCVCVCYREREERGVGRYSDKGDSVRERRAKKKRTFKSVFCTIQVVNNEFLLPVQRINILKKY